MKFCSLCGNEVSLGVPPGDNRPRYSCAGCGTIHYQNPNMVLGTIPVWENRVLLCRRAIEPRYGFWTLPAGFMENGETTSEGAERETMEEAGARIRIGELFSEEEIPWPEIAFRTVEQTLRWYFEDRRNGSFGTHTGAVRYSRRSGS